MHEPVTFFEAVKEKQWVEVMDQEITSIEKNKTWSLTDLPAGHKLIGLKWVYKLKKDSEGKVVKHKARLVAKGYVQRQGIDDEEVFSPVARIETVWLLLVLVAQCKWQVYHMDVKTAFLNGELLEEVYVTQQEGYVVKQQEHKVYRLFKALYGLRQAPRAWNLQLDRKLKSFGFIKCPQEHAVYVRTKQSNILIIGVYVDDLIITGTEAIDIQEFKHQMMNEFEMSDLGLLSYYLGIEVEQREERISLKQSGYARRILQQFGMEDCNPCKCPMEPKLQLGKDPEGEFVDPTEYRRAIGNLIYMLHTGPGLAYTVGMVSRCMEKPTMLHQKAVKQILRYIKGTIEFGLEYTSGGDGKIIGFCDSSLASDIDDRRSTSGMVFYVNKSVISWSSQKQKSVALSSCEAEFMAATAAACQAIWLRGLMSEVRRRPP